MAETAQERLRRRQGATQPARLAGLPKPPTQPGPVTTPPTTTPKLTLPTLAPIDDAQPNLNYKEAAERRKTEEAFNIAGGGSLRQNVLSGPGAIGFGIKMLPTFFGKGLQTALGLVELTSPTGQVKLASGDSRLTEDWQKGKELGLEGDALVAYSLQRQLPLAGDYITSAMGTSRSLAELGTFGQYDAGEEGIDYVNAYRQGQLGAKLVEDVGNILLAGRLAGAGNLAVRGGQAVATAGAPRLGGAIATTGRFIEEPIGTTARGAAGLVETSATRAGRPQLAEAAGRIAAADVDAGATVGPLRQTVNEVTMERRRRASTRWSEIQVDITKLRDEQQTIIARDPANPRVDEINLKIEQMERMQERVLVRAGVPKQVRETIREGQQIEEANRTQFQERAARYIAQGVEARSPEALRASSDRRLAEAQRLREAGDPVRAAAIEELAAKDRAMADLQEQYPGVLNAPVPKEVSPVVHIILDQLVELVVQEYNRGATPQQIADNLTSPAVSPDVQMRGYRYTAADVQYLLDLLNGNLNPAQVMVVQETFRLFKAWSDWITAQQMAGRGRKDPLSPVALQTTPDPKKIIEFIDTFGANGVAVLDVLDNFLAQMVEQIAPGLLKEFDVDRNNPTGLFRKFAETPYGSVPFKLANAAVIMSFDQIVSNATYGYVFRSPDIYPANMRREIEAEERFLAETRAEAVQDMLNGLRNLAEQFSDLLDERTLAGIESRIAKLEDSPLAFSRTEYNKLADSISRLAQRVEKRIEGIGAALERLSLEEQQIVADLEFGYATLNSLEAYLRNLADAPPATSPRLRAAEVKVRDLENERTNLIEEQAQLQGVAKGVEEADAPARGERAAQLKGIRDEAEGLDSDVSTATEQLEVARREAADAESDLVAYETWSQPDNVVGLAEDVRIIRDAQLAGLGPRVSQADAKAAKQAEIDRLTKAEDEAYKNFSVYMPRIGLQGKPKYSSDGRMLSPGLTGEDQISSLSRWLPDTPEQPWLSEFLDEFATEKGMALDEAAGIGGEETGGGTTIDELETRQLSESQYLEEVGRRYAMVKEAEAETARAKKRPIKQYRDDLVRQEQEVFENTIDRELGTGMGVAQIERVFKMVQDGPEATRARLDDATRRVAELEQKLVAQRARLIGLREEARLLEPSVATRVPMDVGIRLTQISRRLSEIDRSLGRVTQGKQRLGPARRSLQFARQAEPREAAQAERAKLRGVGRIIRPEAGAEGPTGTQILRGVRTKAEQRLERLEGREAANQVVVKRLRTDQERLAAIEDQARTTQEAAQIKVGERMAEPFGPQLIGPGTRTTYMPGGTTQNVRNARNVATEMRSAGAAPQMKTQLEISRFTGIQPLSFEETATKIGEITNAYNRHVIVEELLRDPEVTTNTTTLLTQERVDAIRAEALARVEAQTRTPSQPGLLRPTQYDIDARVKEEFGRMLAEEIERKGYEPVSRVDVDPETGVHEAVGNLLEKVPPEAIDENTFLMRKGLAQRIVQQFEVIGQRNVPEGVAQLGERIGRATGAWKTVVLPFSLRWQVGDLAGNVLNAWVIGEVSPDVLWSRMLETVARLDSDRRLLMDSTAMIADPLIEALIGAGLQTRSVKLSSVAALRDPKANPRTAIDDIQMMFGPLKGLRKTMFKFNEFQNVVVRTAFAIEKLDKILRERGRSIEEVTPESQFTDPDLANALQEAVRETHKALGAFSEMSPWERRVIRQIYPFWAWVKFINKAAVNLAIDNPDRVLFTVALGQMVAEPDDSGYFSFLQGQVPVADFYRDLGFVNPYSDAILFGENPFDRLQDTFSGVSPVIRTPLKAGGLGFQYFTGRQVWPFEPVSQPSYLEGRQSLRSASILAGELAYLALKDWGGPIRNILEVLPSNIPLITTEGRLRGTDVAVGPGPRFGQGSLRTGTGVYAQPRLSPTAQRIGAMMRALGIPGAPIAEVDIVRQQAREQQIRDERARLRKERERAQSRG